MSREPFSTMTTVRFGISRLTPVEPHPEPDPGTSWRVACGPPAPDVVERLLRRLPSWFGIESALLDYVAAARTMPAYLAWPAAVDSGAGPGTGSQPAGFLLAARHFPVSAEIYLIAVDPHAHRRGAGRALVAALEADLIAEGARFLQVKTLGPGHPDPGYARTRQFKSLR
jgi:GNAT superfamily N-acetyltransferase